MTIEHCGNSEEKAPTVITANGEAVVLGIAMERCTGMHVGDVLVTKRPDTLDGFLAPWRFTVSGSTFEANAPVSLWIKRVG